MKKLDILSVFLFLLITIFVASCEDKNDDDDSNGNGNGGGSTELTDDEVTNRWIYDKMKRIYLWNESLPSSPDYQSGSKDFFYSILYKYGQKDGDRFSWIEEDKSKQTNSKSLFGSSNLGFDYVPQSYFADEMVERSSLGFFVVYVYEGSDAEAKGLKRGQVIYRANGVDVDYDNYKTVLDGSSLTLSVYDNDGTKKVLTPFTVNEPVRSPVFMSEVITAANKKIGYLVYTAFERTADESDENSFDYDIELIEKIRSLHNQGITEFVLDIRYNQGGYLTSAMDLASALYPGRSSDKVFVKEEYNKYFSDSLQTKYPGRNIFNEYFLDKVYGTSVDIPKLNINRLYIIASDYSASASEAVIHGLKAHMNVYHVGTITVGKDKASMTIKSDDSRIKWQLQPLISRLTDANGNGNYINGLTPDYPVSEWEEGYTMADARASTGEIVQLPLLSVWKGGLLPLGNPTEPMLAEAIAQITGIPRAKTMKQQSVSMPLIEVPVIKHNEKKQVILIDSKKFSE